MQNFLDWLVVGLRWAHIVAILGWVGTAFFFRWLDSKLHPPRPSRDNVMGEAWMGHGGGFYVVERRYVAPGQAPSPVYWFRVEAGVTWITGFLLLVFVYYWPGGIGLVDPDTSILTREAAIGLAIAMLLLGWIIYDRLWVSRLAENNATLANLLSGVLLVGVVYLLCELFTGRVAFLHIGAILGTNMVANVWMRIIPAQEETVAATAAGREHNVVLATRAAQRSKHNTYLALPVILTMISVHAPSAYNHPINWLILSLLIIVGIAARHMMIMFDRRQLKKWEWMQAGAPLAVSVAALGILSVPTLDLTSTKDELAGSKGWVPFTVVRGIIDLRCAPCHSGNATSNVPSSVSFDTTEEIAARAAPIKASVINRSMPPDNRTGMTDEERALIVRWANRGAPID